MTFFRKTERALRRTHFERYFPANRICFKVSRLMVVHESRRLVNTTRSLRNQYSETENCRAKRQNPADSNVEIFDNGMRQFSDKLPFMEKRILERSKDREFNRLVKKYKNRENISKKFMFSITGFISEIWINVSSNAEKWPEDALPRNNVDQQFSRTNHGKIPYETAQGKLSGEAFPGKIPYKASPGKYKYETPSGKHKYESSEIMFYTILYTIHYHLRAIKLDMSRLHQIQMACKNKMAESSLHNNNGHIVRKHDIDVITLLYVYGINDTHLVTMPEEYYDQMSMLVQQFLRQNTLHDLHKWMLMITSTSISEATLFIGQSRLPVFLAKDVLYRNVANHADLKSSISIYKEYFDHLPQTEKHYLILHILSQCQIFSVREIYGLLKYFLSQHDVIIFPYDVGSIQNQTLLSYLSNFNGGYKVRSNIARQQAASTSNVIHVFQLNWLLWRLSDFGPFINRTRLDHMEIVKSQNLIVEFMVQKARNSEVSSVDSADFKTYDSTNQVQKWLNILGTLSLANTLTYISQNQSSKVVTVLESKFFIPFLDDLSNTALSKDVETLFSKNGVEESDVQNLISKIYYVKLRNCTTSGELVDILSQAFNFPSNYIAKPFPRWLEKCNLRKSQLIWRGFVERAFSLKFLNSERAHHITSKILKESHLLGTVNAHMVTALIPHLSDSMILKLAVHVSKKTLMDDFILKAITKKLYQSVVHHMNDTKVEQMSKIYDGILSRVRGFFNSLAKPSASMVGIMLYYESYIQPQAIYGLYYHYFLSQKSALSPGQDSIKALLNASLVAKDLVWENQYAVQIAIYEFKRRVIKSLEDPQQEVVPNLRPSESLWTMYLDALYRYNYLDELLEVVGWWDSIKYIPSKELLLRLLSYFPDHTASKFIAYAHNTLISNVQTNIDNFFTVRENESETVDPKVHQGALGSSYRSLQEEYSASEWPWPSNYELKAFKNLNSN